MSYLKDYVDQSINQWHRSPFDVANLTEEQAQEIFAMLDGDLSPENLHCDGEITAAQARRRAVQFVGAGRELIALGFLPVDVYADFS